VRKTPSTCFFRSFSTCFFRPFSSCFIRACLRHSIFHRLFESQTLFSRRVAEWICCRHAGSLRNMQAPHRASSTTNHELKIQIGSTRLATMRWSYHTESALTCLYDCGLYDMIPWLTGLRPGSRLHRCYCGPEESTRELPARLGGLCRCVTSNTCRSFSRLNLLIRISNVQIDT
jgi:hypothetical protein